MATGCTYFRDYLQGRQSDSDEALAHLDAHFDRCADCRQAFEKELEEFHAIFAWLLWEAEDTPEQRRLRH